MKVNGRKCGPAVEEARETRMLMDEGSRGRQREKHVLSQWYNDVSKRDQAVKMENVFHHH